MDKFFRVPFALSGDKAPVPDATDPSGFVSYTQGYGFDYQRQKTDPLSKNIERDKMNQIFADVTKAIGELQSQGITDFISTALNGGSPYSYAANAVVRYTDGLLYISLVPANTALPTDTTKWAPFADSLIRGAIFVNNVAELRALPEQPRPVTVQLLGYYTPGDGGGGPPLTWVSSSALADNGGTVFRPDTLPATGRWVRKHADLRGWGAKLNDTDDDSDAVQRSVTWAVSNLGGVVEHPGGLCRLDQQIFVTGDEVYFTGVGMRESAYRVYHNLGPAFVVEHATTPGSAFVNSFGMRDVSIRARLETTAGANLRLNKVQFVTLVNVMLEDHFGGLEVLGGANHYLANFAIFSARTSAPVSWPAAKPGSFFYKVGRSSDNQVPFEIFVDNFNFRRTETADLIENGIVVHAVDGLWLNNGHVMGVDVADMRVTPLTGVEQISGIRCCNVWFDNNCELGLHILGNTSALFAEIELTACRFLTPTNTGIFVEASATAFEGLRITGGNVRKAGNYGILLRAGRRHIIAGFEFAACNTNGIANAGGLALDNAQVGHVTVSACQFVQTTYGVTAPAMIGVRLNAHAIGQVNVNGSDFDLDAASPDISDVSTLDTNRYANNTTTKPATATAVIGTALSIAEIGDSFLVTGGLNFDNLTGRWDERVVTLIFAGASTVTHGATALRLAGSVNLVAKAGDTLTLLRSPNSPAPGGPVWIERGRMIS